MEKFAGYGFNKSHSAAYAYLAYVTAYLKAHYPLEFMAALLTSETGNTSKVVKYINECRDMGIRVLPPDVNMSDLDFTPQSPRRSAIRFGSCAIKNVGASAVEAIVKARAEGGPFKSIFDFCERIDLGVGEPPRARKPHQGRRAWIRSTAPARSMNAVLDSAIEIGHARLAGSRERPERPLRRYVGRRVREA